MFPSLVTTQLKDLVKTIRNCKTAGEERAVVAKECATIRNIFRDGNTECVCIALTKLLYFHMLGYPAHFGQIECLKLVASQRFVDKRIGYLGCMMLLDELTDVHVLITNCLKNDLNHSKQQVKGLALCTLASICSTEMARTLASDVEILLKEGSAYIIKKASLCAARIVSKAPEFYEMYLPYIKTLIRDSNVGVQLCGCTLAYVICSEEPKSIFELKKTDIVPTLMKILKNLVNYGSSPQHSVHGVGNPFLQVKILQVLSLLGKDDQKISVHINDLLAQVITNTEGNKNIGNAVLYETVLTVFNIQAPNDLKALAADLLGRFLKNPDKNIKYISLTTMLKIVNKNCNFFLRHRNYVLECLNETDNSIKRRAIQVTFAMIDKNNIVDSISKLIPLLKTCDKDLKEYITSNIILATEKYYPNKQWQVNTFLDLLLNASNHIRDDAISEFVRIVSCSPEVQTNVVHKLYSSIIKDYSKQVLVQVACWCIGEYGNLLLAPPEEDHQPIVPEEIPNVLRSVLISLTSLNVTKYFALYALSKLTVRIPSIKNLCYDVIKKYMTNIDPEIQQRSFEFIAITDRYDQLRENLFEILPPLPQASPSTHDSNTNDSNETDVNTFSGTQQMNAADTLLDLLGGDVLTTSTSIVQQELPNFELINSSSSNNDMEVFLNDILTIHLNAKKESENSFNFILSAISKQSIPVNDFIFQVAVPKAFEINFLPATGSCLLPFGESKVNQAFTVISKSNTKVKLRVKLLYTHDGNCREEIFDVSDFNGNI